eukprot:7383054-Prymnesium_polylepis.4
MSVLKTDLLSAWLMPMPRVPMPQRMPLHVSIELIIAVDLSTQRPHALDAVPVRARCEHRSAVKTLVPCPPNIYPGARRKRVGDATLVDWKRRCGDTHVAIV